MSTYFDSTALAISNGDTSDETDINNLLTALEAAFDSVEAAVDAADDAAEYWAGRAKAWAETAEDVEIDAGSGNYSALHHSAKASAQRVLAETARTGAETARTGAETARTGAQTAQGLAEDAQDAAEVAQGLAEGAADDAAAKLLLVEAEGTTQIGLVQAAGDSEISDIAAAGDAELSDIADAGDSELSQIAAAGDAELLAIGNAGDTEIAAVQSEGTTQVGLVTAQGSTEVSRVTNQGDTEVVRVEGQGDTQVARVIAEGTTQETRVTTEGTEQIGLVEAAADAKIITINGLVQDAGNAELANIAAAGDAELADIGNAGDSELLDIANAGDAEIAAVQAEGVTQVAAVSSAGSSQVAAVIDEGDTQEARVTAEGTEQIGAVEDAADAKIVTMNGLVSTSMSYAGEAESSASLAESAKNDAQTAQGLAEAARDAAQLAETNAETAETNAETAEDGAVAAQGLAEAARDKAQDWAEEDEDVEVETGKYSAKHWASKSEESAGGVIPPSDDPYGVSWDESLVAPTRNAVYDKFESLTKSDVGLGNVDNTSDLNKPVSNATQTALNGKANTTHNHDTAYEPKNSNIQAHISSTANPHGVTLAQVGAAASVHDHTDKLNKAGDTMSGALVIDWNGSTAPLRLANTGTTDPSSLTNGDIWHRSATLYTRLGGSTRTLIHNGNPTVLASDVAQAEAEAGAATTRRWWTAQMVRYAILGWWTASADKTKLDGIAEGAEVNTVDSVAGKTGAVTLVKANVGLGNVDNTSDLNKPISTATQTALDGKEPDLGDPATDGYVLASTAAGVRSWVELSVGDPIDALHNIGNAGSSLDLDSSEYDTHVFICDQATLTLTVSNFAVGRTITLVITNGGSCTITWPTGIKWPGGSAPSLSSAGTDRVVMQKVGAAEIHAASGGLAYA